MRPTVSPPGPKGHFLFGSLLDAKRDELDFLARIVREYGDVVRLRMFNVSAYVLSHPDDIEAVLVTNHRNFTKSVYLTESKSLLGQGLLTSDGDRWLGQRRMLQPSFHAQKVARYGRAILEQVEPMLDSWRDGETRNVHQDMMTLTMKIIATVLFGDDITSETAQVEAALHLFFEQFDERFGFYLLPEWLPTPGNLRYRKALAQLNSTIVGLVRRRQAAAHNNGDMLSDLLAALGETGKGMTATELRDQMMTLFFTGHETTGLALSWTWYLLAQSPRVEAKLADELQRVLGGRLPCIDDLSQLPYTEMVFKESLRLYPPAYAVVRRAVDDCQIGGYPIPAGATVAMFQWSVHRDVRFFDRPEEFIPERWENDFQKRLPRCAYFPFGAGPRLCIGDSFAKVEVPLLLASIVQRFHFDLVANHPVLLNPSLTLRPRKGIKMVVRRREAV
jgi:cytochrome P450